MIRRSSELKLWADPEEKGLWFLRKPNCQFVVTVREQLQFAYISQNFADEAKLNSLG
jgi:hypothetical protein